MDCATIRSDVIGDFQEPYGAVLVEGDDMAALPSNRLRGQPAVAPIRRDEAHGVTLPTMDGTRPVQRNPRSRRPHYRE
jgi:hypothetical protein